MGELFIQRQTGESMTIQIDGTVIKEMQPLQIDWCDKCQKWQPLAGGYTIRNQGLSMIWVCRECK